MAFMSGEAEKWKLNMVRIVVDSTMTGMEIQLVTKAADALTKPCLLRSLLVVIQTYLWLSSAVM